MKHRSAIPKKIPESVNQKSDKSPALIACAKRSSVEKKGIHAWHPYYAGYSEAFVESAIDFLGADTSSLILDPWGGSGTTGIVCARRGITSISVDINPVMAIFAAAKSINVLAHEHAIVKFFSEALWRDEHNNSENVNSGLYCNETASFLASYLNAIPIFADEIKCGNKLLADAKSGISADVLVAPSSFCIAVAFVALREMIGVGRLTNPTWMRQTQGAISLSENEIIENFRRCSENMLKSLKGFYVNGNTEKQVEMWSMGGDVKKIELKNASVDLVITSPPYLTRIDYAVSTLPELSLIGNFELFSTIRHKTIGAPVITKQAKEQSLAWGGICNNVLNSVKSHRTQAAAGYYWKHITQYFMDIDASFVEIYRVLKLGGKGLLVVQSSYFKDIEIPLGEIFVEMATEKKFSAKIVSRQIVRGHMAHKNKKSSVYKTNKVYFEDVILIEKISQDI